MAEVKNLCLSYLNLLEMKKTLLILLFALICLGTSAQNFAVQGRVVDAENVKEGLPMATLRLFVNDTTFVGGDVADDNGYFNVKAKSAGKYLLEVSYTGCESMKKRVELTAKRPVAKLGDLMLSRDVLLDELEVTALAQELTIKADTFVYHTNAFRVPEGSTIAALIKQLPGLTMDSNGSLTFQGKAVSSILVNGKPFIGDANTAMSNIVSDAVQDIAVYEKADEEKEFAGVHDTDKATVVDLKIKKEYQSQWNVNTDLGGGTHSKYMAKAFASNFTDKRRTAVYAQVNNISENQVADENGNWQSDPWGPMGLYTYRKAGAIISWDNGRKNTEAGHLKFNAEVEAGHTSGSNDRISNTEYILGTAGNQYSYQRTISDGRDRNLNLNGSITYNIDTLNRIAATIDYRYSDNRSEGTSYLSTYSAAMDIPNPERGLVGENVSEELGAMGINSNSSRNITVSDNNSFDADLRYLHRFRKEGYSLSAGASYRIYSHNGSADILRNYRYFNNSTPESVERRYNTAPSDNSELKAKVALEGKFNKNLSFSVDYRYALMKYDDDYAIYRLDRYPYYSQLGLPPGVHPSTADSLAAVIDIANSHYSKRTEQRHLIDPSVTGVWDKIEAALAVEIEHYDEELLYKRGGAAHSPSRSYFDFTPRASIKWKPVKNGEISLRYFGYSYRPSLLELLPVTDTSDQMVERVNNPGLKTQWQNHFNLYSRWFNEKRGDSYSLYASCGLYNNRIVDIIVTDAQTGKQRHTKDNVNGNYYVSVGANTEQPLDKERHWTFFVSGAYHISRDKSYVGAMGDKLGLSVVYRHSPRASMSLKWRSGIWNVNLNGQYSADISRYGSTPEYDQSGHTFECKLQPQVDLPFGMKINTSFGLYGRRGYADEIMNHDQWLWNATVSQSFLKNKTLTLQLEAVDILHQRTAEYCYVRPGMRYFNRDKIFYSYVMLHAIYRFNIGGK